MSELSAKSLDDDFNVGQVLQCIETVGIDNNLKDSTYRVVVKDGHDWNDNPCLVVYNPECCDVCKNYWGFICTLVEMIGICDGRVKVIGDYETNPELIPKKQTHGNRE